MERNAAALALDCTILRKKKRGRDRNGKGKEGLCICVFNWFTTRFGSEELSSGELNE